ncbi:MAG TPA: cyanophycin synthetase, partial [Candidatus Aminicenantes bacterium]|nr:cyanophycin synthetase [Candidatus Aminicenantes bacterium]
RIPFLNEGAAENLLAALGVCLALGEPLSAVFPRIAGLKPFAMRGVLIELPGDIKILDDSYNSNPRALASALRSYSALPARRKVAVLADMLELGPEEKKYHLEAGECAARSGWDILVTIGRLAEDMARGARSAGMPGDRGLSFADSEAAAAAILDIAAAGDLILVKGSRGMKAERVVETLNNRGKE